MNYDYPPSPTPATLTSVGHSTTAATGGEIVSPVLGGLGLALVGAVAIAASVRLVRRER